jgi:hypothetical protein
MNHCAFVSFQCVNFQGTSVNRPNDLMLRQASWHLASPHRKQEDKSLSGAVLCLGKDESVPSDATITQAAKTLSRSRASRWAKSLAGFLLRTQRGKNNSIPDQHAASTSPQDNLNVSQPPEDKGYMQSCIKEANKVGQLLTPSVQVLEDHFPTGSKAYGEFYRLDTIWHAQRVAKEFNPDNTEVVSTEINAKEAYSIFSRLNRLCDEKYTAAERAQFLEQAYRTRFKDYKPHNKMDDSKGRQRNGYY